MNYFITAIGTDSGKTLVSAIFVEALEADYWKPIQAGYPRDIDTVRQLVSNTATQYHDEAYLLNAPASPHAAAKKDEVVIDLRSVVTPDLISRDLVVEGVGGLMVPLNDNDLVIDIAKKNDLKIILVCNLYLGSINHSLLSLEYLKSHNYPVKGIIFNGDPNPESEDIILKYAQAPCLLRIGQEKEANKEMVKKYANQLKKSLENE